MKKKFDEIVESYRHTDSMKATVKETNVSHSVVKRVLITAGLITDDTIQLVSEWHSVGVPLEVIAKQIGVKPATVYNYLPYPRSCRMDWEETLNARRIRACRERKKQK